MKLTCPCCGGQSAAEAWAADAQARQAMAALAGLPAPLPAAALRYLALFRPEKSALSWTKACRVIDALAAEVALGRVAVGHKPARPCPPALWAAAIEEMLGRRDRLERPLKNHNYLITVAWGLADAADAKAEQSGRMGEMGDCPRTRGLSPISPDHEDDGLLPIERVLREKAGEEVRIQKEDGGEAIRPPRP